MDCFTLGQFAGAVFWTGVLVAVVSFGLWALTSPPHQLLPNRREVVEMVSSFLFGLVAAGAFYWAVLYTPVHRLVGLPPLCR